MKKPVFLLAFLARLHHRRPGLRAPAGRAAGRLPGARGREPRRRWPPAGGSSMATRRSTSSSRASQKGNVDVRLAAARVREAEALAREAGAAFLPDVTARLHRHAQPRQQRSHPAAASPACRSRARSTSSSPRPASSSISGAASRARTRPRRPTCLPPRFRAGRGRADARRRHRAGLLRAALARRADRRCSSSPSSVRRDSLAIARARLDAGLASELDVHQAQGALSDALVQRREARAHPRADRAPARRSSPGASTSSSRRAICSRCRCRRRRRRACPRRCSSAGPTSARPSRAWSRPTRRSASRAPRSFRPSRSPRRSARRAPSSATCSRAAPASGRLGVGLAAADLRRRAARGARRAGRSAPRAGARRLPALDRDRVPRGGRRAGQRASESAAAEEELKLRLEAARNALELSTLRYESGYSPYLEVLDAQRTANDAELAFVRNRQARLAFSVDLMKALAAAGGIKGVGPLFL